MGSVLFKSMIHDNLLPLDEWTLDLDRDTFLFRGRQISLPCYLTNSNEAHEFSSNACILTLLTKNCSYLPGTIVLIGIEQTISPKIQKDWLIFGQEYGFIFQWLKTIRAIETFNLLTLEKRNCLLLVLGKSSISL